MRILVSGSSGLVGDALCPWLQIAGHTVVPLRRLQSKPDADAVPWDPAAGTIERERLADIDAVVHLAGENIGDKRWSNKQKARIRDSRVQGTRLLSEAVASLPAPPEVLVCASAIGYYGDRGDELLDESSAAGEGFLPEVCREWEAAAEAARQKGMRVVHLRFGVVLSRDGGALQKMLFPFKMCVGGVIAGGRQYWSWVAIDDVVRAIEFALHEAALEGAVNVVAPCPATNREFTKTLGRVLRRPTIMPMPGFLARLGFGEMANDLLIASARVEPKKLLDAGFEFQFAELEPALRHVLGR